MFNFYLNICKIDVLKYGCSISECLNCDLFRDFYILFVCFVEGLVGCCPILQIYPLMH